MKFNHLNVPGHWQNYWTRYPEGHTILEALISWVSQVDSMVDNQNKLNENVEQFRNEIDDFIGRFDERLQTEVTKTLKDWQSSGFLDLVISEALQWQLDEYITKNEQDKLSISGQLTQTAQRLDVKIDTTSAELNARVDETIANAGDGTIPTELTDIRVIRNRTFDVAGSAVRSLATGVSVDKESSGENLYSPLSDTVSNTIIGTDGVVSTASDWTMAKIPVQPNKTYDVWFPTGDYSGRIGAIAFADKDMNVLTHYTNPLTVGYVYNGVTTRQFTSPDLSTHILVNVARPDWQANPYNVINTFKLFNGDPNQPKISSIYGLQLEDKSAHERINAIEGSGGYSGTKITFIGDSNTENNSRATVNYVNLIEEKMGFNVTNLGVSGTGFKRGDNESNGYYQRVSQIPLDTEVLIIDSSLNDLGSGVPLGNWNDNTAATIAGAINMTLDAINTRLPIVSMGICGPIPWKTSDPSWAENEATKYAVLLEDICKRKGIPYLDMYFGSGLRPWSPPFRELVYKRDGDNGVHPDEDGHRIYIYSKKREFIKTLI